jgi:hypothetical protein
MSSSGFRIQDSACLLLKQYCYNLQLTSETCGVPRRKSDFLRDAMRTPKTLNLKTLSLGDTLVVRVLCMMYPPRAFLHCARVGRVVRV